jgi:hypothetical protein
MIGSGLPVETLEEVRSKTKVRNVLQRVCLMLANLFTMFFGAVAGWFGTHFLTRPLLKVYEYREKVHQLVFYTANVGETALADDPKQFKDMSDELRRLAAQIAALAASMPPYCKPILAWLHIDLAAASRGLISFSNSLIKGDGSKLVYRQTIERALRLPPPDGLNG